MINKSKGTKKCPQCKATKRVGEFNKLVTKHDGLHAWCKSCQNASSRAYYSKHLRVERYGITKAQYDSISVSQNGLCAICFKHRTTGRRLAVDHNHATGTVRGLLCIRCNADLGIIENQEKLRAMMSYIAKHKEVKHEPR